MRTMWTFQVPIHHRPGAPVEVEMPALSVVRCVDLPSLESVTLWAEVETSSEKQVRTFSFTGTGHAVSREARWVATVEREGVMVHVWEHH